MIFNFDSPKDEKLAGENTGQLFFVMWGATLQSKQCSLYLNLADNLRCKLVFDNPRSNGQSDKQESRPRWDEVNQNKHGRRRCKKRHSCFFVYRRPFYNHCETSFLRGRSIRNAVSKMCSPPICRPSCRIVVNSDGSCAGRYFVACFLSV